MKKAILRLAIPNIIANLSIPMLSIADAVVLGHLPSPHYLAAVSLAGVIFNFILWSFSFLRMSGTGLTAQALGAGDKAGVSLVLYRSLFLSLVIAGTIILLRHVFSDFGFNLLQPSETLRDPAMLYYQIRIFAVPAAIINFVITGWLLGMQDSAGAMLLVVFENVVNVIMNIWFVSGLGMDADGVALGTLIARWSALVFGAVLVLSRHRKWLVKPDFRLIFQLSEWWNILKINTDIFIRTLSLLAVFSWFTWSSSQQGTEVLALNSLLLQFFIFFSFFIDGLSFAGESLSGKLLGARKFRALRYMTRIMFVWAGIISLVFSAAYLFAGPFLFRLMTSNEALITLAQRDQAWVVLIPLVSFTAFVWDGIFAGVTHTKAMRNVMLVAVILIFFPLYFLLENILPGNHLWIAFLAFFAARSMGMTLSRPAFFRPHKEHRNPMKTI